MLCAHPCWKWPLLLLPQIWRAIHTKIASLTARERERLRNHSKIKYRLPPHTVLIFFYLLQSPPRTSWMQTRASCEAGVAAMGRWPTLFAAPPTVHQRRRPPLPLNGGSTRVMVRASTNFVQELCGNSVKIMCGCGWWKGVGRKR